MPITARFFTLLAVLAAVIVAGCGGDGSSEDPASSEPLSADAYETEVNGILGPLGAELQTTGAALTEAGNDPAAVAEGLTEVEGVLEEGIGQLEEITPPEEAQEGHENLIAAFEGFRSSLGELREVAEAGDQAELQAAAQELAGAQVDFQEQLQEGLSQLDEAGITIDPSA